MLVIVVRRWVRDVYIILNWTKRTDTGRFLMIKSLIKTLCERNRYKSHRGAIWYVRSKYTVGESLKMNADTETCLYDAPSNGAAAIGNANALGGLLVFYKYIGFKFKFFIIMR